MIRKTSLAAIAMAALSTPALADGHVAATGDASAGEGEFRQCQSCHVVQTPDGETLAGRRAQTGPNLYGVAGRTAGMIEDFRYSDIMLLAGEQGVAWDEENFVAYLLDPTGHLQEVTGDGGRGKMSYRVRDEADAVNLYAYLAQFGTPEEIVGEGS